MGHREVGVPEVETQALTGRATGRIPALTRKALITTPGKSSIDWRIHLELRVLRSPGV